MSISYTYSEMDRAAHAQCDLQLPPAVDPLQERDQRQHLSTSDQLPPTMPQPRHRPCAAPEAVEKMYSGFGHCAHLKHCPVTAPVDMNKKYIFYILSCGKETCLHSDLLLFVSSERHYCYSC